MKDWHDFMVLDGEVGVSANGYGFYGLLIGRYHYNELDECYAIDTYWSHPIHMSAKGALALLDYLTEHRDELQEAADDEARYQAARTELEARNG